MSGAFAEAAARLQEIKSRNEEAMSAVRGAQTVVQEVHSMLGGVYDGVNAGDDVMQAADLADDELNEALEVLQRVNDLLDQKITAAMSGNA